MKHMPLYPFLLLFFISLALCIQILFTVRFRFESTRCSNPQVGEKFCYAAPECKEQSSLDSKIILEDVLSLTNDISSLETPTYQDISIDYYDRGNKVIKTFNIYSILNQDVPSGGVQFPEGYGSSVGYYNLEKGVSVYLMGLSSNWSDNSNQILSLYTEAIGSCITGPGTSSISQITDKGFFVSPNKNDKTLTIELITTTNYSSSSRSPNLGISSSVGPFNIFTNFNDKKQLNYVQRIISSPENKDLVSKLRTNRIRQIKARISGLNNKCLDPSGAPPSCGVDKYEYEEAENAFVNQIDKSDIVNYCVDHSNPNQIENSFQTNFYNFNSNVNSEGQLVSSDDYGNYKNAKFEKGTNKFPINTSLNNNYLSDIVFCGPSAPNLVPGTCFNFTDNKVNRVWTSNQPNAQKNENVVILGFN